MVIVSAFYSRSRERPQEKQRSADDKHRRFIDKKSDFLAFLNLWHYVQANQKELTKNQFRRLCQKDYLNYLRIREWQDVTIKSVLQFMKWDYQSIPNQQNMIKFIYRTFR